MKNKHSQDISISQVTFSDITFDSYFRSTTDLIRSKFIEKAKDNFKKLLVSNGLNELAGTISFNEKDGAITFIYDLSLFRSKYNEISSKA